MAFCSYTRSLKNISASTSRIEEIMNGERAVVRNEKIVSETAEHCNRQLEVNWEDASPNLHEISPRNK